MYSDQGIFVHFIFSDVRNFYWRFLQAHKFLHCPSDIIYN